MWRVAGVRPGSIKPPLLWNLWPRTARMQAVAVLVLLYGLAYGSGVLIPVQSHRGVAAILSTDGRVETSYSGCQESFCVHATCRRCWRAIVARWYSSRYGICRCQSTKMIFNHFAASARSAS